MAVDTNNLAELRPEDAEGSAPVAGRRYRRAAKEVHLTVAERVPGGRRRVRRCRGPATPCSRRCPGDPTRSTSSRSRPRPACPSSSRSATAGCSCRRSPSTAARRCSWRPTWQAPPRSGLTVQLCGDAHLSNFGVFASPERRLVFDINDFDETLPGPVGVGRQAPGRQLRGRRAGRRATATKDRRAVARCRSVARTARPCATFAGMTNLDVWYARLDVERGRGEAEHGSPDAGRSSAPRPTWPRPAPATACRPSPS